MKGGTKMPKTALLSLKGEKIKDIKLDDNVWGITPNDQVVYEHINLFMANRRQGTHATKTRSDVSGGGRKPWRQKGTGNARQGSTRAPHWVGGGVVFGPSANRNYTKKMNKKERKLALKSALTYKANDKDIIVVDKFEVETNKTKELVDIIKKEFKNFDVKKEDFERKKKAILAACIYMSDNIYSLNKMIKKYLIMDCETFSV